MTDFSPEVENCRDYLRTGRCKYGESCKYYHPPNVEHGGGVKGPLNPGEPAFPLRPGEPPCQYYLKHGSCKFGQTCKFDHPALSPRQQAAAQGSQASSYILSNNSILPQRPNEPDCIYFLRNGRCKYGATCKYHHPLLDAANASVCSEANDSAPGFFGFNAAGGIPFNSLGGTTAIPVHIVGPNGANQGSSHILWNEGKLSLMLSNSHLEATANGTNTTASSSLAGATSSSAPKFQHSNNANSPVVYPQSPAFSSISSHETYSALDSVLGRPQATRPGSHSQQVSSPTLSALPPQHSMTHNHLSLGNLSMANQTSSASDAAGVDLEHPPPSSPLNHKGWARASSAPNTLSPSARAWEMPGRDKAFPKSPTQDSDGFLADDAIRKDSMGSMHSLNRKEGAHSFSSYLASSFMPGEEQHPVSPSFASSNVWAANVNGRERNLRTSRSLLSHDEDLDYANNWDDGLSSMTSSLLNMIDTTEEKKHKMAANQQQQQSPPPSTMFSYEGDVHTDMNDFSQSRTPSPVKRGWHHSNSYG